MNLDEMVAVRLVSCQGLVPDKDVWGLHSAAGVFMWLRVKRCRVPVISLPPRDVIPLYFISWALEACVLLQ